VLGSVVIYEDSRYVLFSCLVFFMAPCSMNRFRF
jgi:hypothetical protein